MTRLVLALGLLFLWLPTLLLVGYAFSGSRTAFEWGGFSTRWFAALAQNERLVEAALLSLQVATGAATLAALAGLAVGWVLARHGPFAGRPLFGLLAAAPLVLPEVVMGAALLLLLVAAQTWLGWPEQRGGATVLLAHAALGTAYVALVAQSRLAALDPALEEAAADLGAGPGAVFRTVTLPLVAPSLLAGWALAFVLSLDDVVLASFTSGPGGTTLPLWLFSQLRLGLSPEANALAAVMLAVVLLGGLLAWAVASRRVAVAPGRE